MSRVRVLVEGQTEQTFARDVLAPLLAGHDVYLYPMLFGTGGGIPKYAKARKDIVRSLKADSGLYCTTIVDFYGMPKDWPGREQGNSAGTSQEKAGIVENALMGDIAGEMGGSFNPERFIPYVQMHEFEAILFSDPVKFADLLGSPNLAEPFQSICDEFDSPEEINDNYETAPSRRIKKVFSSYSKIDGVSAAKQIGLQAIRAKCPHFDQWLSKLEQIGRQ